MATPITDAIDSLDDEHLEEAVADFLAEHQLTDDFLVWLEKWKSNHQLGG